MASAWQIGGAAKTEAGAVRFVGVAGCLASFVFFQALKALPFPIFELS